MLTKLLQILSLIILLIPYALLGQEYSVIVNTGFVFIDGKYVDIPYKLYQKESSIFINEYRVSIKYGRKNVQLPIDLLVDPLIPEGINKWTKISELNKITTASGRELIIAKMLYESKNNSKEVAYQNMIAFYKKFPFIKSVKVKRVTENAISLYLYDHYGNYRFVPLDFYDRINSSEMPDRDINVSIKNQIDFYSSRLIKNGIFFFWDGSMSRYLGRTRLDDDVHEFLEILVSAQLHEKEQIQKLVIGKARFNHDRAKILINENNSNSKLKNRVQKLSRSL